MHSKTAPCRHETKRRPANLTHHLPRDTWHSILTVTWSSGRICATCSVGHDGLAYDVTSVQILHHDSNLRNGLLILPDCLFMSPSSSSVCLRIVVEYLVHASIGCSVVISQPCWSVFPFFEPVISRSSPSTDDIGDWQRFLMMFCATQEV